jgi:hypothetical protein
MHIFLTGGSVEDRKYNDKLGHYESSKIQNGRENVFFFILKFQK